MDQTLRKAFDPRKPHHRNIANADVSRLISSIKEVLTSACVLFSIEYGVDDDLPQSQIKKAIRFMSNVDMKDKALEEVAPLFIEHCQLSRNQVNRIEISTRGQQSNQVWFDQRQGRITASKFHLVATKCESLMKKGVRR